MSENLYLKWLCRETPSVWWHDSAIIEELDQAMANGAVGATTNPFLIKSTLFAKPEVWRPLLAGIDTSAFAYFVHSYAAPTGGWTLASCDYGSTFSAVVQHRNFFGAQFHPERSAAVGARLLQNFIGLRVPEQ